VLRRLLLLAVTLPLLAAGTGVPTFREEDTVGKSGPGSKNAAEAQKAAEDDAIRAAVEAVSKELLGDKVAADKLSLLATKILKNARRYVPEFKVTDRSEAGGTVIEKVHAKVNLDLLKGDLVAAGILASDTPTTVMTKVVVLPAPAKSGTPPWWAAGGTANSPEPLTYVIVDALRAKGFEVTEPRRAEPDPNSTVTPTPAPTPDMGNPNLLAVGRSYGADLAIRVPWDTQVAVKSLDGISYALARAKVGPVDAIVVKDGTVATSVAGEGVAGEVIDPIRAKGPVPADIAARISAAALKDAGNDLADHLTGALGDPVARGGSTATIQLVVAGLDSYVAYARFEAVLGHDLKSVRNASLHSIERGEATYELTLGSSSDAGAFADEIGKKDFSEFTVKVTEKTPSRVVVHVVR
jgi:hypothetical protein